ncbi:MAG: retropepsin-like domain-containing protein [Lewinellaceae bacterium]|nr:retropepsin-like domain-containing protein [Lewinellaceae bacterium]MCB9289256.1 retropepsin-like domain-containing protein [Lewinellaceae bacterium]
MKRTAVLLMLSLLGRAVPAGAQSSNLVKIPFELVNGLVLVSASINGDTGSFILDTGSPMVVVNPRNVEGLQPVNTQQSYAFRGRPVKVNHFSWAGIEREGMDALAMDISHLENASHRKILGVIGYEVLNKYEVMFDCRNQVLLLYEPRNSWIHERETPLFSFRFQMRDELPVIKARIGGKKVHLGLDTGGTANLLSEKLMGQLPASSLRNAKEETIFGLANIPEKKNSALVDGLEVEGKLLHASRFLFTDLSHLDDVHIEGLLAMPFLSQFRFSINYRKNRVYIWSHGEEINFRTI